MTGEYLPIILRLTGSIPSAATTATLKKIVIFFDNAVPFYDNFYSKEISCISKDILRIDVTKGCLGYTTGSSLSNNFNYY